MRVIGDQGDRYAVLVEHLHDRLDPELVGVGGDLVDHDREWQVSTNARFATSEFEMQNEGPGQAGALVVER